ncbi:hypothetical protein ABB37_05833 [Leptomonas pyrrhocoris]|uniref:Surface antigen-like protein n=1 Tax=Leptomonas pyrrhocoris TaxID=157538 RepID=A0A0N0DUD0_LEPPY|nr:hypothetical protein ABB37_05825 [Leptomonas pyrrhocoris]XP_015657137.1 hypothetical protein ABB37_05833 [Leptomonas pyrrhocoris]KPA78688.1 hypothetical protein ABB37_05825 [Leptomonas pyrrhocoris]KPA78698.1 hypothetical protein ABB37_05833 [Leptomonas pyrrhocoris]|eukprot:XP_015657127.1 hypothetical protein ABB37_05825 [Leptomonas pyrrhocoris]
MSRFCSTPQPWNALALGALLLCCVISPHLAIAADGSTAPAPTPESETMKFLQALATTVPDMRNSQDEDYCGWNFVQCSADNTVTVKLTASQMTQVSSMPDLPGDVVGSLVTVTWAEGLRLYDKLTGTLPPSWGRLTQMQTLELATNALNGTLPAEWSTMTQTTEMNLADNQLLGTLPAEWSAMTQVSQMMLLNNSFCGCVPTEWTGVLRPIVDDNVSGDACATTNACHKASSSSSGEPTCFVVNCVRCAPGNSMKCSVCDSSYMLTDDSQCAPYCDAAYWLSLGSPNGWLMLALLCASVLWNLI